MPSRTADEARPTSGERATVIAELPKRLYRLQTEDGAHIIAGLSEQAKRVGLRILAGEHVLVHRTRLDPGRGTILAPTPAFARRKHQP